MRCWVGLKPIEKLRTRRGVKAKVNETNKIFRVKRVVRSKEKKFRKSPKKDLTEPTLLEMPGKSPNRPSGCWCRPWKSSCRRLGLTAVTGHTKAKLRCARSILVFSTLLYWHS